METSKCVKQNPSTTYLLSTGFVWQLDASCELILSLAAAFCTPWLFERWHLIVSVRNLVAQSLVQNANASRCCLCMSEPICLAVLIPQLHQTLMHGKPTTVPRAFAAARLIAKCCANIADIAGLSYVLWHQRLLGLE